MPRQKGEIRRERIEIQENGNLILRVKEREREGKGDKNKKKICFSDNQS